MADRIFYAVHSTGIAYCDRQIEEHGDYKRLGFLSFATLKLDIASDCPQHLRTRIIGDAAEIQARRGEQFPVTVTQTITLGHGIRVAA